MTHRKEEKKNRGKNQDFTTPFISRNFAPDRVCFAELCQVKMPITKLCQVKMPITKLCQVKMPIAKFFTRHFTPHFCLKRENNTNTHHDALKLNQ